MLDTNVVTAAAMGGRSGANSRIIDEVATGNVRLALSDDYMGELVSTMSKPRVEEHASVGSAVRIALVLAYMGRPYTPRKHDWPSIPDRKDWWLLQRLAVVLHHQHYGHMKAYSIDLRTKIVESVRKGVSTSETARRFGVNRSTVNRYLKRLNQSGSLAPERRPGKQPKLDERAMLLLEEDIEARPWATHNQRSELLYAVCAVRVSEATICRSIKRLGHSRKKDQHKQANVTSG